MKLSQRTISLFLALSMLFMLTGCKESNTTEYTTVQSFEYHFFPSSTVSFTVIIEEETNGSVIGEILSR